MKFFVEIQEHGPIVRGVGGPIVDRNLHVMTGDLAQEGVRRVHQRLGQVLRHPTGYYSSRVISTVRSDGYDIDDSRVVYGPWLEGVGSRNKTTRFKGYHTFRLVGAQLDVDALPFLQRDVEQMVMELNSGD